jgi:hypothetical protein
VARALSQSCFHAIIALYLPRRKTPLPDEAFERESFYDERHRPASTICRWVDGFVTGASAIYRLWFISCS